MKNKELIKNFLSGLFVMGGIALIIIFIFIIGKDKGFSQPKFQMMVLFRNVGGLSEGAPVRLSGVNVGSVGNISFLRQKVQGRRVKVGINIFSKYKEQFIGNLNFEIKTEGILGEKLVEISVIESEAKVVFDKPILGQDPIDIHDMADVFAKAAQSFTNTSDELGKIDMMELTNVMSESSRALLETSQGINEIMGDIQNITRKSKRLFDRIEQKVIEGSLFKVF